MIPSTLGGISETGEAQDRSETASVSSENTVHVQPTEDDPSKPYFSQSLNLKTESASFHVLLTPPKSPEDSLVVFHHGAGSSSLSFCLLVEELQKSLPNAGFLAVDARGHGSTVWDKDGSELSNFEIQSLSNDLATVIKLVVKELDFNSTPSLWLVGHSVGGAVVTKLADDRVFGTSVLGVVVLDVVEGSAISALKAIRALLPNRPQKFQTVQEAVDWHLRTKALRNPESAKISVPGMLTEGQQGEWVWKAPLEKTEPYWDDWFVGMSKRFLATRGAKLLVLAGTDRLDKELMIGQMQGKFQLAVIPPAGHFIHEDEPAELAQIISTFITRNDRSKLVLPMKVSDMIALGKRV